MLSESENQDYGEVEQSPMMSFSEDGGEVVEDHEDPTKNMDIELGAEFASKVISESLIPGAAPLLDFMFDAIQISGAREISGPIFSENNNGAGTLSSNPNQANGSGSQVQSSGNGAYCINNSLSNDGDELSYYSSSKSSMGSLH